MDCEVFTLFKNKQRQCGQPFFSDCPFLCHFFHYRKFIWSALLEKAVLGEKQDQHKQGGKLLAESTVLLMDV
jgi:hypothetical protein